MSNDRVTNHSVRMNHVGVAKSDTEESQLRTTARDMSESLAKVFRAHDNSNREDAIESLIEVDRRQFSTLDTDEVELASTAFVDALFAKDEIEFQQLTGGQIDATELREADYSAALQKLRQRLYLSGRISSMRSKKFGLGDDTKLVATIGPHSNNHKFTNSEQH